MKARIAVAALFLLFGVGMAQADLFSSNAKVTWQGVTFQVPIDNLSAITLVNLWGGHTVTMIGGETPVISWNGFTANMMVVTSGDNEGAWGGTINYNWAKIVPKIPVMLLDVGLFAAENFETNTYFVGLKAAQKFW